MTCMRCQGARWVCENHPDRPFDKTLPNGCDCGAGEPCADCNGSTESDTPNLGSTFDTITAVASGLALPRRTYMGTRSGPPVSEAEHYSKCALCGAWVDRRDFGVVADHSGPLPHPAEDQTQ